MEKEVRNTTTIELVKALCSLYQNNIDKTNQSLINLIAYELTCRTYVPCSDKNFDEILLSYGYVAPTIEREKEKKLIK